MPFSLRRQWLDLEFRTVELIDKTVVTPTYVRVRLGGPALRGFHSPGADDHVRIFLPTNGAPTPSTVVQWQVQPSREYTPAAWDGEEGWLDLELVLHDGGLASDWARAAEIGSSAAVGGPRGSMLLEGTPDSWLLAGDETAIPAIRRWLDLAGPGGRGVVLVEEAGHGSVPLPAPAGFRVERLARDERPGQSLARRLEELADEAPVGSDPFVFVAAEQSVVRAGRALLTTWGVDPETAVVKGYWKTGDTEYHAPH